MINGYLVLDGAKYFAEDGPQKLFSTSASFKVLFMVLDLMHSHNFLYQIMNGVKNL